MRKILFLDESCDNNPIKIDQPIQSLFFSGVIADKKYAEDEMVTKVFDFKKSIFGNGRELAIFAYTAPISLASAMVLKE